VVLELKDKAPAVMAMGAAVAPSPAQAQDLADVMDIPDPKTRQAQATRAAPSAQAEALSALGNLGYGPGEAAGAVAQAAGDLPQAATPDLIRAALKLLAPKG
jgi:Holliday junction DNA helicase RuvA